jgi:hypothetical protein
MGEVSLPKPGLLIVAAFSRHEEALVWAKGRIEREWGEVLLASDVFDFTETEYYAKEMGEGLKKVFFVVEGPFATETLPERKLATNGWEQEYAGLRPRTEIRPLNLDPGYVTEAKLVLATTKDRDHRLYLGQGIFGEVTLTWRRGEWASHPWTYADYQRADVQAFLTQVRERLRERLKRGSFGS